MFKRVLVAVVCVVAGVAAPLAAGADPAGPGGAGVNGPDGSSGAAAIAQAGSELSAIAGEHGMTANELRHELTSDSSLHLDEGGKLFYTEPVRPTLDAAGPAVTPRYADSGDAFTLHSRPGSDRVMYIDADGGSLAGTVWEEDESLPTTEVTGYDLDSDPETFTLAEEAVIAQIWAQVAEDYAPFDIDVTTEEPPASAIERTNIADEQYGTVEMIIGSPGFLEWCSCGGRAYIGIIDRVGDNAYYQPGLALVDGVGPSAKNLAEVISHEAGHNVGLLHDGAGSKTYYGGKNGWAPIMGVSYYQPISQFSMGEYTNASQHQDDYAVMASNGVDVAADDHGDTVGTATAVGALPAGGSGLIGTPADRDAFSFSTTGGEITVSASPAATAPNLDIGLSLRTTTGDLVAYADPASAFVSTTVASGLSAEITGVVVPAGTYVVTVEGVGRGGAPSSGPYTDYGSLGAYTFDASVVSPSALPHLSVGDAETAEGATGFQQPKVSVSLDTPSAFPITVTYQITSQDATGAAKPVFGTDFLSKRGTLVFKPGQVFKAVPVRTYGDGTVEPDEHVAVTVEAPSGVLLGRAAGEVTIHDDDPMAGTTISVGGGLVVEGDTLKGRKYLVPISASQLATGVTVSYTVSPAGATFGSSTVASADYYLGKPTYQTTFTTPLTRYIAITVWGDDAAEPTEGVTITLTGATGGATIGTGSATLTILDDD